MLWNFEVNNVAYFGLKLGIFLLKALKWQNYKCVSMPNFYYYWLWAYTLMTEPSPALLLLLLHFMYVCAMVPMEFKKQLMRIGSLPGFQASTSQQMPLSPEPSCCPPPLKIINSWAWWHTPLIPALRTQRQAGLYKSTDSLIYIASSSPVRAT